MQKSSDTLRESNISFKTRYMHYIHFAKINTLRESNISFITQYLR